MNSELILHEVEGVKTDLLSVMDMRRCLTGGTQCLATSAPFPFSTRHEPASTQMFKDHILLIFPDLDTL